MRGREHVVARIAIAVAGSIGLAVAARTAWFYLDVDRAAFALSLLVATGLVVGIAELFGRVGRAERIESEVASLPRPATLEAIDGASAPLRGVLRARLGGARATVTTAGFAPYLVGLLVMVGLLGTFLGLVDALRGARDALGTGGDIDALRSALALPMLGLSRAFGISAAGLCASAMLGLASVFARRVEASLANAVQAYGDDALLPLTVAERQIAALEALVRQSAEASAAAVRAQESVEATAVALRAEVATGVAELARAVERTLTPALDRAVSRASDVTRERLDDWTRVLDRESEARRARDTALGEAWADAAGRSAERVSREGARVLGEVQGALGETLSRVEERLGASVDALAARLGDRSRSITDDLESRLAALTATTDALVRGLSGELEGTRARLDRTLEATTQALEAHVERSLVRERAREDAMDARAAAIAEADARALVRLERHVEAVDAALAGHLERVTALQQQAAREAAERAIALDAALREHAAGLTITTGTVLGEASRRAEAAAASAEAAVRAARDEIAAREALERAQAARAEALERAQAARAEALEQAQAARAEAVVSAMASAAEQVSAHAGRVLGEQAERQARLEAQWIAAHDASAASLVALLDRHAAGLAQALGATRGLVDDAAGVLRASGVEMGAVAEVFTAAVDRYRDASAACVAALSGIDGAVDQAGKKAAIELLTDYLEQTREVFDHSIEVQRELFGELRALRGRGTTTSAAGQVLAPESARVRVG